jgi:hypothetical protein
MDEATAASLADALDQAIAAGVLSVQHGDTRTQFRSLDDMYRVRDDLRRQAGAVQTRLRTPYQLTKAL